MKNKTKIFFLSIFFFGLFGVSGSAQAANHYVRQGDSGNGSDWTNAYSALPASLVRGDTYYIADGSYGTYTFDDGNSGTQTITVRKATIADHGTETGWQNSYGDGQAVWTDWNITTDYWTFDGVARNSDWSDGALDQYGFKTGNTRLDNGSGSGGDNLTFKYTEIHGGGRDTGDGDDVIYGLTGNSNVTFQYCALHDSDRTIFLMRGNWQNLVIDHCYLARNTSTPATHGEFMSLTDATNLVVSNNVFVDIEGTAVIAGLNGGTLSGAKIYGNVVYHSQAYIADTGRVPGHNFGIAGLVYIAHDASNNNYGNNILVYNNTLYHIQGTYSGVHIEAGSGNSAYNNIWHSCVRPAHTGVTTDYNYYYNTSPTDDDGTHNQSGTANIFVKVSDPPNLHLTVATNAGTGVGLPYNIDIDGSTRGADGVWDRGAYEYVEGGGDTIVPGAPLDLSVR